MTAPKAPEAPARRRAAALVALALLASCSDGATVPRSLLELERFAFVPAGTARSGASLARDVEFGAASDLLVDRFEVSREQWAAWTGAPPPADGLRTGLAASAPGTGTWPAFASYDEAADFAALRGMRLPTVREWVWIAAGTRAAEFPWGGLPRLSVANTLELDLRRPVSVGTFEQGRSAQGCYDMVGNVAEWATLDALPVGDAILAPEVPHDALAAALGGSFLNRLRPLFRRDDDLDARIRVAGEVLPRATRGVDLGLRCVVEADAWLAAHLDEWRGVPDARARLVRVGERWGAVAVPRLEALAATGDGDGPLDWLLAGARR